LDILNTIDPYHEIYKKHNNGSIKEKLTSETPIILISFTVVPPRSIFILFLETIFFFILNLFKIKNKN
jgi:hypothetical protein